jgi:uncharacterized protein
MIQKIKKEDLKPGEVLCSYCTAKCCRYFAFPIDTPDCWEDFDHLRWYMIHGRVSLFVEDNTWYIMIHADCRHLQEDHLCGNYLERPNVCREYTTENCEFEDDACYDKYFESPDQIWEYAEAVLPQRKRKRKTDEISLPVLSVN